MPARITPDERLGDTVRPEQARALHPSAEREATEPRSHLGAGPETVQASSRAALRAGDSPDLHTASSGRSLCGAEGQHL